MRKILLFASPSLLFVLVAGCVGADNTGATSASLASPAAHLTHKMPRGSSSTASVRTLPNAACRLRVAGAPDDTRSLRVLSDDDGVARIQIDHLDPSVSGGTLTLDCADGQGARLGHTIDVVIDDNAQPQSPAPYRRDGKPTLAVLDVDPMSLSDAEIHARHYPPRPDAAQSPDQYNTWLKLVSSAPVAAPANLVADGERFHVNGTSNNWSGYVITNPGSASKYEWIFGQWSVPRAYAESGFYSSDHSSFWVGIDGWGSPDVVQDGTDSDTLTVFWVQTSSYGAWTEWYPLSSQGVSNFPVNPGDVIHAWTWLRDGNGNWSNSPTVGWFYMWNETENAYVYTSTNVPSGTTFNGHAAEWVLERPTVSGSVSTLANYSWAQLTGALAYDLNGGAHNYGGGGSDTSWNVTMVDNSNNNTVLSTVAPVNASTMAFTFHNHN
jgi:hypothetical protein